MSFTVTYPPVNTSTIADYTWTGWWTFFPELIHRQSVGGNCTKCWESWPCREVRRLIL